MRFVSRIDVFLPGDIITRTPGVWDRLRRMWAPVDLGTNRIRDWIEAATFVYELRGAFDELGIDNARSLVVDGMTSGTMEERWNLSRGRNPGPTRVAATAARYVTRSR